MTFTIDNVCVLLHNLEEEIYREINNADDLEEAMNTIAIIIKAKTDTLYELEDMINE